MPGFGGAQNKEAQEEAIPFEAQEQVQQRISEANDELQKLRESGIIKAKGKLVLPPKAPEVLVFEEHALNRIAERKMSVLDAEDIIDHALFALKQRNGGQYVFYSDNGFVSVFNGKTVTSIGRLDDGGKKIVEVAKKYGLAARKVDKP